MAAPPCDGLTVLDFSSGQAGALASLVLADFGAEVIKVEPPDGDPFRSHPAWLTWSRGKKGIVLDLETADGRERAQRLAERADIVLESFAPGVTQRLGIDYAMLSRLNPRLVYASITGWGQHGPLSQLPPYEGVVAAKSGRMWDFQGQPNRPGPVYSAVQVATWAASQAAVRGILATLRIREQLGHGQWVQTSLLQAMLEYDFAGLINGQFSRQDPQTFPPGAMAARLRLPMLQYIPVRTKDGRWLQHANLMARLFQAYLRAVGLGWVFEDERFKQAPAMSDENREILREIILEKMQEKTLDEWMQVYMADGDVAAEPYLQTVDGMKHEQFVHNQHVIEIDDPRVGTMKTLGLLAKLAESPGKVGGPAPDLGQHTAEVVQRLATQSHAPAPITGGAGTGNGAQARPVLDGVTMLDFSTVLAGPYGAAMIADMGARVIKVDATPEREQLRMGSGGGPNLLNLKTYGGKECLQLDLQTPEGKEIAHQLIARADVLLHNFRPGVPERLAIDWETCKQINPRLVHVYVGAYGATGPHRARPGAHPLPGALFGGALRQAGQGMPPPADEPMDMAAIKETSRWLMRANEGNPDLNASQSVATSVTLGLLARERTGVGQAIEVTMMQANAWANAEEAYDYAGRPDYAIPDAECYGLHALYRLYEASEGWVFLGCLFDHEWEAFCRAADRAELLDDPRFATAAAREQHDSELAALLASVFRARPALEWEATMVAAGVACVEAGDTGAFYEEHPQSMANSLTVEVDSPRFGKYFRYSDIIKFSETPNRFAHGSFGGEHTVRIMQELGYDQAQIEALRARRVIDWEEVNRIAAAR